MTQSLCDLAELEAAFSHPKLPMIDDVLFSVLPPELAKREARVRSAYLEWEASKKGKGSPLPVKGWKRRLGEQLGFCPSRREAPEKTVRSRRDGRKIQDPHRGKMTVLYGWLSEKPNRKGTRSGKAGSEPLAEQVAHLTGVDAAWLLSGDGKNAPLAVRSQLRSAVNATIACVCVAYEAHKKLEGDRTEQLSGMITHKWSVYEAIGLPDQSMPARRWMDLARDHEVSLPDNFEHGYDKAAEAMARPYSVTLPRRAWINLYAFSPARWCLPPSLKAMVTIDADKSVFFLLIASAGFPALRAYWSMVENLGGGKAMSMSWWDKEWKEFTDDLTKHFNERRRISEIERMRREEAEDELPSTSGQGSEKCVPGLNNERR